MLAVACLGLALLGFRPFRLDGSVGPAAIALAVVAIVVHLVLIAVAVAKGKYRMALFAAFIPLLGSIAGIRLARPGSRWARRFYDTDKMARAERRAAAHDGRYGRFTSRAADLMAGEVASSRDDRLREDKQVPPETG